MINFLWDIFLFALGGLLTHIYHKLDMKQQQKIFNAQKNALVNQIKNLTNELSKYSTDSKLILYEERMNEALLELERTGNCKNIIDAFPDMTQAEKAKFYEDAFMRAKGKQNANNPYL